MTTPAATPTEQFGLNISTDVGDVANAVAAVLKLADAIFEVVNSPAMVAARQSAAVQAALVKMDDDLKEAQATGDLSEVNREASG